MFRDLFLDNDAWLDDGEAVQLCFISLPSDKQSTSQHTGLPAAAGGGKRLAWLRTSGRRLMAWCQHAVTIPLETVAGVQRMPDLALPVVVVRDEARAARALVSNTAPLLARSVYLHISIWRNVFCKTVVH